MAKVPNGVETLTKISTGWVRRTNVTDRRYEDSSVCTGLFVRGAFENVCLKGAL